MKRCAVALAVSLALAGCNKSSPTGPSPTPTPTTTRILNLGGDLTFGNVPVATLAQRTYTVNNSGNSNLSITDVVVPPGFVSTLKTTTLFPGETSTFHVIFLPDAARAFTGQVSIISNRTSGTSTMNVSGTGTVAGGLLIQNFSADISGGDTHCRTGLPPFDFDVGPCKVFDFTTSAPGRFDAQLTYNGDTALLSLDLYDPDEGTSISRGDITFDPYPGSGEHSSLNVNMSRAGRFQWRVRALSASAITRFSLVTTRPN